MFKKNLFVFKSLSSFQIKSNFQKKVFVFLFVCFLFTSCATIYEKMQRSIQDGKYSEAITTGETFITKKPESPDAPKVRALLMDAEFRLARLVDTLERYDAYDRKFPDHPFKTDLIAAEYVLYKAMNSLDGFDEFNRKFPDHPYRNDVIQAELDLYKLMNTLEGYDAFNGKFPGHDFQDEVMEAEYALYKAMDTLEGFETFEKKFPSHSFADDLAERKSRIYYQTVTLPKSSSAAFKDFLSRYPNSSFAQEAREKANQSAYAEVEASWKEAGDKNTVEAFEVFCKSYPDSHRVAEAREKICEIAWKEAETLNTIDACLKFKNDHSTCISQVKLAESKAEDMAWKDAVGKNTPEAYKQYREQYPASLHVTEAQAREVELQKVSAPLAIVKVIPPVKASAAKPITAKMVDNVTFKIVDDREEGNVYFIAKFKKGVHEPKKKYGEDYLRAEILEKRIGDIDGDGVDDAVIIAMYTDYYTGNSIIISLSAILAKPDKPLMVDPILLGSAISWKSFSIKSGKIHMTLITLGPNDPQCCPSVKEKKVYQIENGKIVEK